MPLGIRGAAALPRVPAPSRFSGREDAGHGRARDAAKAARARPTRAGRDDLRSWNDSDRGGGDPAGRVRFSGKAARHRPHPAHAAQRPATPRPRERERTPQGRGTRAVRDRGDEPRGEAGDRAHREGRADRRARAHHGRERNREGARGPCHPCALPARARAVRGGKLRCDSHRADRERAVRAYEGELHGRVRGSRGEVRAGGRRHAVSRRDR